MKWRADEPPPKPFHIDPDTAMFSKILPTNEGTADRVIRAALGLGLLSLVFVGPQTPWGWLGLIPLATAALGSCPAYTLLGLSTCPTKNRA